MFAQFYFIYYIYTLLPSKDALEVYTEYRTIIYVALLSLLLPLGAVGLLSKKMLGDESAENGQLKNTVQIFIPPIVTQLLLTSFSYAIAEGIYRALQTFT